MKNKHRCHICDVIIPDLPNGYWKPRCDKCRKAYSMGRAVGYLAGKKNERGLNDKKQEVQRETLPCKMTDNKFKLCHDCHTIVKDALKKHLIKYPKSHTDKMYNMGLINIGEELGVNDAMQKM